MVFILIKKIEDAKIMYDKLDKMKNIEREAIQKIEMRLEKTAKLGVKAEKLEEFYIISTLRSNYEYAKEKIKDINKNLLYIEITIDDIAQYIAKFELGNNPKPIEVVMPPYKSIPPYYPLKENLVFTEEDDKLAEKLNREWLDVVKKKYNIVERREESELSGLEEKIKEKIASESTN